MKIRAWLTVFSYAPLWKAAVCGIYAQAIGLLGKAPADWEKELSGIL